MRRRGTLAGVVVGGVALLLVLAQLTLPALAGRSVRGDLERDGAQVRDVQVRSLPAWRLLGGSADRLDLALRSARGRAGAPGALDGLLERVRDVDDVYLGVDRFAYDLVGVQRGTVTLGPVRVRIRDERLRADVSVPLRGIAGALLPDLATRLEVDGGRLVLDAGSGPLSLLDVVLVDAVHLRIDAARTRRVGDVLTVTVDGRRDRGS